MQPEDKRRVCGPSAVVGLGFAGGKLALQAKRETRANGPCPGPYQFCQFLQPSAEPKRPTEAKCPSEACNWAELSRRKVFRVWEVPVICDASRRHRDRQPCSGHTQGPQAQTFLQLSRHLLRPRPDRPAPRAGSLTSASAAKPTAVRAYCRQ